MVYLPFLQRYRVLIECHPRLKNQLHWIMCRILSWNNMSKLWRVQKLELLHGHLLNVSSCLLPKSLRTLVIKAIVIILFFLEWYSVTDFFWPVKVHSIILLVSVLKVMSSLQTKSPHMEQTFWGHLTRGGCMISWRIYVVSPGEVHHITCLSGVFWGMQDLSIHGLLVWNAKLGRDANVIRWGGG